MAKRFEVIWDGTMKGRNLWGIWDNKLEKYVNDAFGTSYYSTIEKNEAEEMAERLEGV